MDFAAASTYLLGTINETVSRRLPGRLERMRALLAALGDPHRAYPTIHVGGTSGKGSTSTMLAATLSAAGKKTGLHTKPHLISMTERMRIDGVAIEEQRFADMLLEMLPVIDRIAADYGRPTYYETLLALSFAYFAAEAVDVAVIEVGLGGTLDGTNLVAPEVSVITNIGLDHVDVLGDTVEQVALDKSGIAKTGVPLVSDVNVASARSVIEAQCAARGAPFLAVRDLTTVVPRGGERYGQSFLVQTPQAGYEIALPVLGEFQQRNAATTILALEQLPPGLRPAPAAIERGLAGLVLMGRMEFYPSHPSVVFDIAHNPDKARALADGLRSTFPNRRFAFVVAIGEGKDAAEMLATWAQLPASFVFTSFEAAGRTSSRPARLQSIAESVGKWGRAVADPIEALEVVRRHADAADIVVVTGSTYIVAKLREWWLANVVSRAS